MKTEDITTGFLSAMGLTISLSDFRNWLDIVLIILSIINILIVLLIKLRKYLKDGRLDENERKDISDDIQSIHDEIEKLKKDGDSK